MQSAEQLNFDRKEETLDVKREENIIFVVAGKLGLEAVEDKILILIDKFKSGYECKDCNGTGKYIACDCLRAGREFGVTSTNKTCRLKDICVKQVVGEDCKTCKGKGDTLVLPENARAIPTSGIIVSKGPLVTKREIGERVLFGAHTGYYLPFKGNAKIRCMREDEVLAKIYSIGVDASMGDFVQIEEQQY
jgi:co-chaperonin GroES (HSP10)